MSMAMLPLIAFIGHLFEALFRIVNFILLIQSRYFSQYYQIMILCPEYVYLVFNRWHL